MVSISRIRTNTFFIRHNLNLSIMKKVFLTLALLVCTMVANAQFYIGGGLGFWSNDDADKTAYSINPDVGYVFNEKLSAGIALGYEFLDQDKLEMSGFSVNPYVRYTFFRSGAFSLFADGAFELATIEPDEGDSETAWGIGIKPGLAVALSPKFSAVAHVGFLGYRDADEIVSAIYEPGFGLNLSNSLSFSLYYSF